MKKVFYFIILLIAFIAPKSHAVDLGPFDVTIDFCKNLQLVTNIVSAWSNAAFPVTGQPGFVIMTIQRTNPVIDLCDFIVQLQMADTTDAIFLTAEKLNDMTDQKWNDQLRLTRKTYQIANSVYDFNSGQKRAGSINAVSMAADLGEWQRMATELATGNNPQAVKERQEYDRQVAELADIALQRAILKEGTNCPEPAKDTPDYYKIIDSDIVPRQKTVQSTERDLNFIRYQLIDLGPRFLTDIKAIEKYYEDVQNLLSLGVTFAVADGAPKSVLTTKPTGAVKSDGTAIKNQVTQSQVTQTFTANLNSQIFINFRKNYEAPYQQWAAKFWEDHSDTEGGRDTLQTVFKPLAFDCNETKLMRAYPNLSGEEYERKKIEQFTSCESNNKMSKGKSIQLLGSYVTTLKDTLLLNKKTQGEIWGLESKHLGRKRAISLDKAGNYFQESVVCQKTPEMIDLEVIQTKQQSVNAAYNEIIARETLKDALLRDEELRQQKANAEQNRLKQKQIEKDHSIEREVLSAPVSPDLGGSF